VKARVTHAPCDTNRLVDQEIHQDHPPLPCVTSRTRLVKYSRLILEAIECRWSSRIAKFG
jgi:hypothetical protein